MNLIDPKHKDDIWRFVYEFKAPALLDLFRFIGTHIFVMYFKF